MRLSTLFLSLMLSVAAFAQTDIQPTADTIQIIPDTRHTFYLLDPVKKVEGVIYKQSGKPVLFKVTDDGKAVLLFGYEERQGLEVEVQLESGARETLYKSPCDIYEDVAL